MPAPHCRNRSCRNVQAQSGPRPQSLTLFMYIGSTDWYYKPKYWKFDIALSRNLKQHGIWKRYWRNQNNIFHILTLLDPDTVTFLNRWGPKLSFELLISLLSLFRSTLEVEETQICDGCATHFQHHLFLTYRYVMHLKKFLKAYWLHNWNKKCKYFCENNVFDHFCQKITLFQGEKSFWP